jgi:hypothetical protein
MQIKIQLKIQLYFIVIKIQNFGLHYTTEKKNETKTY